MSVLELLELQARARAIRSQLALEPVTKIELDSDNEEEGEASTSTASVGKSISKAVTSNSIPKEPEVKPVRLKRNFRQRQSEMNEDECDKSPPEKEEHSPVNNDTQALTTASQHETPTTSSITTTNPNDSKNSIEIPTSIAPEKERSASPDIVTFVPSPETFCISSESENEDEQFLNRIKSSSYLKMPEMPQKEDRPETADELFLRKVKESSSSTATNAKECSESNEITPVEEEKLENQSDDKSNLENVQSPVEQTSSVEKQIVEEQEEGEITEEETTEENSPTEINKDEKVNLLEMDKSEENILENVVESNDVDVTLSSSDDKSGDEKDIKDKDSKASKSESNSSSSSESDSDSEKIEINENPIKMEPIQIKDISAIEIDDDDDIIDLGKDEEMDFESKDDQLGEGPSKKSKLNDDSTVDTAEIPEV